MQVMGKGISLVTIAATILLVIGMAIVSSGCNVPQRQTPTPGNTAVTLRQAPEPTRTAIQIFPMIQQETETPQPDQSVTPESQNQLDTPQVTPTSAHVPTTVLQLETPVSVPTSLPVIPTVIVSVKPTDTPEPLPTMRPVVPAIIVETATPQPTTTSSEERPTFFRNSEDLKELTNSTKPVIDPFQMEKVVHDLVNDERAANGLTPLMWDDEIAVIARMHSEDMAANDYFDHENLRGQLAADRGNEAGYECIKVYENRYTFGIAENLFQGWLYSSVAIINGVEYPQWNTLEQIADTAVEGWMESPGHRENILTETYDRAGMGVAIAENGKVYITQNFC
jgi:uncharacterized protein YkwD